MPSSEETRVVANSHSFLGKKICFYCWLFEAQEGFVACPVCNGTSRYFPKFNFRSRDKALIKRGEFNRNAIIIQLIVPSTAVGALIVMDIGVLCLYYCHPEIDAHHSWSLPIVREMSKIL